MIFVFKIFFLTFHFFLQITIDNAKLCLLNTHLESTKEFSAIRQQQLAHLLRMFDSIDKQHTIIAAGDFNLRDKEV